MPRPTPWKDESTLLCEACGYVVEGLATDTNCPECGRPIAQSLPERRPGTAYQNRPSLRTIVTTGLGTLRHPVRTLDEIRFDTDPDEDDSLGVWHAFSTGVVLVVTPLIPGLVWGGAGERSGPTLGAMLLVLAAGFGFLLVVGYFLAIGIRLLTMMEAFGLRFISARRGFRITRRTSTLITSHGSVGWTAGSLGAMVSVLAGVAITPTAENRLVVLLSLGAAMGCLLGGFLFFETFAWLGLRRLKYANTRGPGDSGAAENPVARAPGS